MIWHVHNRTKLNTNRPYVLPCSVLRNDNNLLTMENSLVENTRNYNFKSNKQSIPSSACKLQEKTQLYFTRLLIKTV